MQKYTCRHLFLKCQVFDPPSKKQQQQQQNKQKQRKSKHKAALKHVVTFDWDMKYRNITFTHSLSLYHYYTGICVF